MQYSHRLKFFYFILITAIFCITGPTSFADDNSEIDALRAAFMEAFDEVIYESENTYVDPSDYYTTNIGVVLYELNFKDSVEYSKIDGIFREFMTSDSVANFVDLRYDTGHKYIFAYANGKNLSITLWRRPNYPIINIRVDWCYWGYITLAGCNIPVYGSINPSCDFLITSSSSNPKLFPFYIDPYVNSDTFDMDIPRPKLELNINDDDITYIIYMKDHFC